MKTVDILFGYMDISAVERAKESLKYGEQKISATQEKVASIWQKIAAFFSFFKDRVGSLAFHLVAIFHIRSLLEENKRLRGENRSLTSQLSTTKTAYQTLFHKAYALGQAHHKLVKEHRKLQLEKNELQIQFDNLCMNKLEDAHPHRITPTKTSPLDDSWTDLSNDKRDETSANLFALLENLAPEASESSSSSSAVLTEEELRKLAQDLEAADL